MDSSIITIEILRSQILEIHQSIQDVLLEQTVRKSPGRYKLNETRRILTRVSVTCLDATQQTLVVEELSRLFSLAESLKTSFDVLTRTPASSTSAMLGEDE